MENIETVFTSTFYGLVFSILTQRKFVSMPGLFVNKVKDRLNRLDLDYRISSENFLYENFEEFCPKI